MKDLAQKVEILEKKVEVLEETLLTLKNMQLSEQLKEYLGTRTKVLKMMSLLNCISEGENKIQFDTSEEKAELEKILVKKQNLDEQVKEAIRHEQIFSDDLLSEKLYFDYEIENDIITESFFNEDGKQDENMNVHRELPKKGLRITAYNGFNERKVIIPKEIDGMHVISIGENAFKNASFSEVILPSTVRAIFDNAFNGCKNLERIDLPEGLSLIGRDCFSDSGLKEVCFPNSVGQIEKSCCSNCKNLETVRLGENTTSINEYAFMGCSNLKKIDLPTNLIEIHGGAFAETNLKTLVLPENMVFVSTDMFVDIFHSSGSMNVDIVVNGKNTVFKKQKRDSLRDVCDNKTSAIRQILDESSQMVSSMAFRLDVGTIYCLPGSNAQRYARENDISVKPLSEFRMENHQ